MATNEFERDLEDQAGLKRPGRIDMRVFQNTADAGDGHPGVQRCFRNYLHEGGIEKDIQLLGFSILGDSVSINNAELQQLSNIGANTISNTQWEYLGELDQPLKQADSPTFSGLTLGSLTVNGAITITGNVDGVDVSDLKTAFDNHKASSGADHTYINQDLKTTFSPTFVGLTLSADLVTTSTVDGVDIQNHTHGGANQGGTVSYTNLSNRGHALSGGDHTASGLTVGYVIRASGATTFAWAQLGHGDLSAIGSNAHSVIDTHLGSTSNPHTVTLNQAFIGGKIITGANSLANGVVIGDGTDTLTFASVSSVPTITGTGSNGLIIETTTAGATDAIIIKSRSSGGTIQLWTNNAYRIIIDSSGDIEPLTSNQQDLGSLNNEWQNIYACGTVQDTTCADFSHYSIERLYNLFAQIKPMVDGGLHYTSTTKQYFPHMDFQTLPEEFGFKAEEDMVKENLWELNELGEIITRKYNIKKGDIIGIDSGTHQYALAYLVVKMYEQNKLLEERITELEVLKTK